MKAGQEFSHLRLEGVGRAFAGTTALAGLDLTIERGEFIALLGPSGCGKSTALNCLAGLLPLTTGRIWLDDTRLDTLPAERRGFGMVFQNYALFPHLTVRSNIAFGLQMRRLPKAEIRRRTDEAIKLVRLQDQAGKLPGQLSGGQQQRVAIARAVVLEPTVVLMDEPLSNLDAKLRLEMRTEIRRLHASLGLTTVYVTHDQEEALSLADRLVVLRAGRVQQIGTPEDLHDRPRTRHVADFMGFRNLLPLRTTAAAADGAAVVLSGGGVTLTGVAAGPLAEGLPVVGGIRPEDIEVLSQGQDGDGTLVATVDVVEYSGREFSVEVLAGDGLPLHVRTPVRLDGGSQVRLRIPAERLLVFPADDDPADAQAAPVADPASEREPVSR